MTRKSRFSTHLNQQCQGCHHGCGRTPRLRLSAVRDPWSFCPLWPCWPAKRSAGINWEWDTVWSPPLLRRHTRERYRRRCQALRRPEKNGRKKNHENHRWKNLCYLISFWTTFMITNGLIFNPETLMQSSNCLFVLSASSIGTLCKALSRTYLRCITR